MEQLHTPVKGISADIEPTKRDSLCWDFPTEGIRILNRDGQGMIVTLMPGNSKAEGDDTPEYYLSSGFVAIGACTYNNVVYLVSHNKDTTESELGSFPGINPNTGVYEQAYFPFSNLMSGSNTLATNPTGRIVFRTNKLLFNTKSQVDVFAVPSYDMSVDLFMCDFQHPNLVINSGFVQSGQYNIRTYNDNSFPYGVRMIQHTDEYPEITFDKLTDNGVLLPGNYYFFLRYTSESFDKTAFLTEIGPISVHIGNYGRNIEGVVDELVTPTTKGINLIVNNIDQNYKYIEIGVWRYHGPGISLPVREEYGIYKYYDITGASMNILINGNEERVTLTLAEVLNQNAIPPICKSHTTAGNRYLGANWKDVNYDRNAIREFASRIYPTIVHKALPECLSTDYEANATQLGQYKDIKNVLESRSHMRGEIYPYAIVGVLSTGKHTEAFPIMDCDFVNGGIPNGINNKGLIRIPDYVQGTYGMNFVNDLHQVIGLEMQMTGAITYFNANKSRFENIIGFFFVRSDRKKNTVYQGWANKCYNKLNSNQGAYFGENIDAASNVVNAHNSLYIPLAMDEMYGNQLHINQANHGIHPVNATENRFALFSPDYILSLQSEIIDNFTYYIKKIAYVDPGAQYHVNRWFKTYLEEDPSVDEYRYFMQEDKQVCWCGQVHFHFVNPTVYDEAIIYNIPKETYNAGDNWSSKFLDYNINQKQFAYFFSAGGNDEYNHSMATSAYLGIRCKDQAVLLNHYFLSIVKYASALDYWTNIYNDFISSLEDYKVVDKMILFSKLPVTKQLYTGDCFINRTFIRTQHWHQIPASYVAAYPYGYGYSMLSENMMNSQLRNDVEATDPNTNDTFVYTYFPKCLTQSAYPKAEDFFARTVSDAIKSEALYVNSGYNVTNGGRPYKGFDPHIPFIVNSYPNRIHVSSRHIPGSYINFYRVFGIESYKDFPWEDGPINCIRELFGRILSVTDSSINEHLFNESPYHVPTSQGELLLGTTDVLAPIARKLVSFGSKHTHGIARVGNGIVGVDVDRDILWRVMPSEGGLTAENMSLTYQIQSECKKIFSEMKSGGPVGDLPAWGNGVSIGYDPYFKEIFFSISKVIVANYQQVQNDRELWKNISTTGFWLNDGQVDQWFPIYALDDVLDNGQFDWNLAVFTFSGIGKTFHFSEEINAFMGTAPFIAGVYFHNGKDFFSGYYRLAKQGPFVDYGIFKHNNEDAPMTFYGVKKPMKFSVMVNGLVADANTSQLRKIFKAGSIISGPEPFDRIDVETEFQKGSLAPFKDSVRFWKSAVWQNHMWEYPMPLQDSNANDQFQVDTDLRGLWARITIVYNSTKKTFIQSIRTLFNITSS